MQLNSLNIRKKIWRCKTRGSCETRDKDQIDIDSTSVRSTVYGEQQFYFQVFFKREYKKNVYIHVSISR